MNIPDKPDGTFSRPSARFSKGLVEVRASAAGKCRRALWYDATGQKPSNPPGEETRTILETGNALEPVVLGALARAGWNPKAADEDGGQREIRVDAGSGVTVTGHIDAIGTIPETDKTCVIEIKTRGPAAFRRWHIMGAEISHPESVAQAAIYTMGLFGEARDAAIVTMDTGSRTWDYEIIPARRVLEAYENVCSRLAKLGEHHDRHGRDAQVPPERDFDEDSIQCRYCPHRNTCRPAPAGSGPERDVDVVTEDEAMYALHRYEEIQEMLGGVWDERKRMIATMEKWLRQQGVKKATLQGQNRMKSLSMEQTAKYTVNHKRMNEFIHPDIRRHIVTEDTSESLQVF